MTTTSSQNVSEHNLISGTNNEPWNRTMVLGADKTIWQRQIPFVVKDLCITISGYIIILEATGVLSFVLKLAAALFIVYNYNPASMVYADNFAIHRKREIQNLADILIARFIHVCVIVLSPVVSVWIVVMISTPFLTAVLARVLEIVKSKQINIEKVRERS